MLRRNLDFLALAAILLGMTLARHIPPPSPAAAAGAIRFQDAVLHDRCVLLDRILRK